MRLVLRLVKEPLQQARFCDLMENIKIADEFENLIRRFNSIDSLTQEVKDISVEHARDILRNLRIKAGEGDTDAEKLDIDESKREIAEALLKAARAAFAFMAGIVRNDKDILGDKEFSALFESTVNVFGKACYRVRLEVINILIKQGKPIQAEKMKQRLEVETPARLKTSEGQLPMPQLIGIIEDHLVQIERIQKKISAHKKIPDLIKKDSEILNIANNIGGAYRVKGINIEQLIGVAQQANEEIESTFVCKNVKAVSEEKIVPAAQKANEGPERTFENLSNKHKI